MRRLISEVRWAKLEELLRVERTEHGSLVCGLCWEVLWSRWELEAHARLHHREAYRAAARAALEETTARFGGVPASYIPVGARRAAPPDAVHKARGRTRCYYFRNPG
jgi:hypothetical protein